jgi:ribosome-binding protein aMBF1 (putative translation factor)
MLENILLNASERKKKGMEMEIKSKKGRWPRAEYLPSEIDYLKFIGLKIKRRRRQLRLSQTQIGRKIFTTFQQVQKYEKGKNVINNVKMERLRKALSIPKYKANFLHNKYNPRSNETGN